MKITLQERILVVKCRYGGMTIEETANYIGLIYKKSPLKRNSILKIMKKFEKYGSVTNQYTNVGKKKKITQENINEVRQRLFKSPVKSIRKLKSQINFDASIGSLSKIIHNNLGLKPYKVQIVQHIPIRGFERRKNFAGIWKMKLNDENILDKIIFTDEAHFELQGFVNTQNYRIWGSESPRIIIPKKKFPERVTVFCGLNIKLGILGPYYFEDGKERPVTVNSANYKELLEQEVIPDIIKKGYTPNHFWYQQDNASAHTTEEMLAYLESIFEKKIILNKTTFEWPPNSPDLNPLDFFFWGYLKDKVFKYKNRNRNKLKENFSDCIKSIEPELIEKVIHAFPSRIEKCLKAEGEYFEGIIR